jgi:ferredoxin--NADP+ reductase
LAETDIADYALEALRHSRVKTIYVIGRRGPAQAAFTNPEIKELGEMADADVIVSPAEVILDPYSQQFVESGEDKVASKNVEILKSYAAREESSKSRKIVMRFLLSPVEIIGDGHVQRMRLVRNELVLDAKGNLKAQATEEMDEIPVGLVFRSVGYHGVKIADVPFDERRGIIPNDRGRVLNGNEVVLGEYVVGWIKRGPSGVIGTNKPDAVETVEMLLEDTRAGKLLNPSAGRAGLEALLKERGIAYVTYGDWQLLDEIEQERGEALGRPRLKFSRVEAMLSAIAERKSTLVMEAAD